MTARKLLVVQIILSALDIQSPLLPPQPQPPPHPARITIAVPLVFLALLSLADGMEVFVRVALTLVRQIILSGTGQAVLQMSVLLLPPQPPLLFPRLPTPPLPHQQ